MKIGVSLSDFYFWNKRFDIKSKLSYVKIIKSLGVDAIEMHFSKEEISKREYNKFRDKLGNLIVTVHLPGNINNEKEVRNIKDLEEALNVKHFVIHANEYSKNKRLFEGINLIIENCDKEKEGFQKFEEVKKLNKPICLDVNHFEENFPGRLESSIKRIKKRIKEIHISALNNRFYDYPHKTKSRHYLVYGSDYKIPKLIPKRAIWIIEGILPKDNLKLLKKEIKLLRNI